MAYYRRKKGIDLWKETIFKDYGFCLCCKEEVSPGDKGYKSIRGNSTYRSICCNACYRELADHHPPGQGLSAISRFKLQ